MMVPPMKTRVKRTDDQCLQIKTEHHNKNTFNGWGDDKELDFEKECSSVGKRIWKLKKEKLENEKKEEKLARKREKK